MNVFWCSFNLPGSSSDLPPTFQTERPFIRTEAFITQCSVERSFQNVLITNYCPNELLCNLDILNKIIYFLHESGIFGRSWQNNLLYDLSAEMAQLGPVRST